MTTDVELELTVRIAAKEEVAENIVKFDLVPVGDQELPEAEAGAHINIQVPNGEVRKYSLCQGPDDDDRYIIAVKREEAGKGGSKSLIDDTQLDDQLSISKPVNDFPLTGKPTRYIFIAGGIGITPIYSMVMNLMQSLEPRPFKLYYLTRNPEQTAFLDILNAPEYKGKVVIHHDNGDLDQAYDLWPLLEQPKGAYVYCCGPRALMEDVRDMTGHWPASSVHFEDFGAGDAAHQPDDKPFKVRISGEDVVDVPADVSILESLREHGYKMPSSCESGTCGTCRCVLIEGEVDHRDLVLTEEEKEKYIMVCVSRAAGDEIEIELPE